MFSCLDFTIEILPTADYLIPSLSAILPRLTVVEVGECRNYVQAIEAYAKKYRKTKTYVIKKLIQKLPTYEPDR